MAQIRAAIAAFHLPTLLFAAAVVIASSVSVNGQPLDLTTAHGRAVAAMACAGILVAIIRTWLANRVTLSPPLAQQLGAAAVAAGLAVLQAAYPDSLTPRTSTGATPLPTSVPVPPSPPVATIVPVAVPIAAVQPPVTVTPILAGPEYPGGPQNNPPVLW